MWSVGAVLCGVVWNAIGTMETAKANEVIYYRSIFRHGVDEKHRVQIPAKWRPSDPSVEFTLVPWPNGALPEACLQVLPPVEMHEMVVRIKQMSTSDPKAQTLRRLIGGGSAGVELDKAGRICLPEEMMKRVGITDEVVLVGLVDRFEIWNPERFDAVSKTDAALLPEAFKLI
jgi:MraZ protein